MKKCISLVLALLMALALCTVSWADVTSAKDFPTEGTDSDTVYWTIGTEDGQSGYAATLTAALTAAYKANSDGSKAITIICKPNADVGTMTHGHVADDLTIYATAHIFPAVSATWKWIPLSLAAAPVRRPLTVNSLPRISRSRPTTLIISACGGSGTPTIP